MKERQLNVLGAALSCGDAGTVSSYRWLLRRPGLFSASRIPETGNRSNGKRALLKGRNE
jgi:hypothetical protein